LSIGFVATFTPSCGGKLTDDQRKSKDSIDKVSENNPACGVRMPFGVLPGDDFVVGGGVDESISGGVTTGWRW